MTDQASDPAESTETVDSPEPTTEQPLPEVDDSALEKAQESIEEAKDAEGSVAASDDITTLDDERAGQYSEDQDGGGGT